jgi:nucleoside-diphosphate-sugar epimerase
LNILITGMNGFIGRELTDFFTKTEHNVFATCRKTLDVSNEKMVDGFFKENDIDIVLHTAIKGGKRTKKDTYFDLVENLNMFKNLYKHRERYGLMISFGSGAEANSSSYYGLAKKIIASEIEEHDGNIANLRIFGCFGPTEENTRFIKNSINRVFERKPIIVHQNKQMDYFYINDLKKVVLYYIENRDDSLPKTIDMCYDDKTSLLDIARKIKTLTKSNVDIIIKDESHGPSYIGASSKLTTLDLDLSGVDLGIQETIGTLRTTNGG